MSVNDGGPAFPTTPVSHGYCPTMSGHGTGADTGMSLRDYLAGQALAGFMAMPDNRTFPKSYPGSVSEWQDELIAEDARYMRKIADAMLKELGHQ